MKVEEKIVNQILKSKLPFKKLHKKKILSKPIKSNKAELIEVLLKPDQKIIPKLQFGKPIEDLSPLLPRDEFRKNMFVKTVSRSKKIFEAN